MTLAQVQVGQTGLEQGVIWVLPQAFLDFFFGFLKLSTFFEGPYALLSLQGNILSSRLPTPKNEIRKILMGLQYLRK
jgi:hypothetical protein